MGWKSFRDRLALFFGGAILALWGLHGGKVVTLPDIVIGSTISIFTLIVQFYFRKKPENEA